MKIFKKILRKAVPIVAGAIGGPAGAIVANAVIPGEARELFNLETEGLSNEDSEFEIARAFVRFAGNVAKDAAENETGDPVKDAEFAIKRAARRFAPGLLRRRRRSFGQNRPRGRFGQNRSRGYRYGQSRYRDYPYDQMDDDQNDDQNDMRG